MKLLSSGDALLLVKGKSVIAKANIPLSEGTVLALKVQETLPTPTFKLLGIRSTGSNAINLSTILSALKENPWATIYQNIDNLGLPQAEKSRLRELLDDLSHRLFLKPGPDMLKTLIDKSGLSWEAKILKAFINKTIAGDNLNKLIGGDLKGLVSSLLNLKQEEGVLLRKIVSTIENLQLLNHLGLHHDRKLFLPVPIQFPNGPFSMGQLLIHLPRKAKEESGKQRSDKTFFSVTFMLDLSNLGPVRADLAIKGESIEGRFLLAKEDTKLLIENNLASFIGNLKDRGFTIHRMDCQLKEPGIIRHSLIKEIVKEKCNTICLVA
ncbi:MAG: flagellar hook-length control protein FliK [Desulfobacterales bacterium]|nr:flagellar hook-length control protein FliK [Desulfobacterales bacterium]